MIFQPRYEILENDIIRLVKLAGYDDIISEYDYNIAYILFETNYHNDSYKEIRFDEQELSSLVSSIKFYDKLIEKNPEEEYYGVERKRMAAELLIKQTLHDYAVENEINVDRVLLDVSW